MSTARQAGLSSSRAATLSLEAGERRWGSRVTDALAMPFGHQPFEVELVGSDPAPGQITEASNQASPLLLSGAGRAVHSAHPFRCRFGDGMLEIEGQRARVDRSGDSLRTAFRSVVGSAIRPSGRIPHRALPVFERVLSELAE